MMKMMRSAKPHAAIVLGLFVLVAGAAVGAAPPALAQFGQQGAKLVGGGYIGTPSQGVSVAISADGQTAVVGGPGDDSQIGAVWVYARSGSTWNLQQGELVGSGYSGAPGQGVSVALSADGNTLIVGGGGDNAQVGAAWVFTRSGGTWSQQARLVGNDYAGTPQQGVSVALSADGNTAIVGGWDDNGYTGAAWVYTRSGNAWTQQGPKLVSSDFVGLSQQGAAVALSADGNTAIVGGPGDDNVSGSNAIGAAWVWTRSGGTWAQQGSKLVGSGYVNDVAPGVNEGHSVALSADGNTALIGGPNDNSYAGAVWVFTRSGGAWTQQGSKLVGSGNVGTTEEGESVALSADGNTAIIGGPYDNTAVGATWIFDRTGGAWTQQGAKLVGSGVADVACSLTSELPPCAAQGYSVAISADGNHLMVGGPYDNAQIGAAWMFIRTIPTDTHDFNGDGVSDILWSDTSGDLAIWLMGAGQFASGAALGNVGTSWSVAGTRDFNGDGDADILWLDGSGDLALWLMNGTSVSSFNSLGNVGTS